MEEKKKPEDKKLGRFGLTPEEMEILNERIRKKIKDREEKKDQEERIAPKRESKKVIMRKDFYASLDKKTPILPSFEESKKVPLEPRSKTTEIFKDTEDFHEEPKAIQETPFVIPEKIKNFMERIESAREHIKNELQKILLTFRVPGKENIKLDWHELVVSLQFKGYVEDELPRYVEHNTSQTECINQFLINLQLLEGNLLFLDKIEDGSIFALEAVKNNKESAVHETEKKWKEIFKKIRIIMKQYHEVINIFVDMPEKTVQTIIKTLSKKDINTFLSSLHNLIHFPSSEKPQRDKDKLQHIQKIFDEMQVEKPEELLKLLTFAIKKECNLDNPKFNKPESIIEVMIQTYFYFRYILDTIKIPSDDTSLKEERQIKMEGWKEQRFGLIVHDLSSQIQLIDGFCVMIENIEHENPMITFFIKEIRSIIDTIILIRKNIISGTIDKNFEDITNDFDLMMELMQRYVSYLLIIPDITPILHESCTDSEKKEILSKIIDAKIQVVNEEEFQKINLKKEKQKVFKRLHPILKDLNIPEKTPDDPMFHPIIVKYTKEGKVLEEADTKYYERDQAKILSTGIILFKKYLKILEELPNEPEEKTQAFRIYEDILKFLAKIKPEEIYENASHKKITKIPLSKNSATFIHSKETLLYDMLYNLVKNAIRSGGDYINVDCIETDTSYICRVTDQNSPFDTKNNNKKPLELITSGGNIFKKGVSTTGSGAGLFFVHNLIKDQLNGNISFKQIDYEGNVVQEGSMDQKGEGITQKGPGNPKDIQKTVFLVELPKTFQKKV